VNTGKCEIHGVFEPKFANLMGKPISTGCPRCQAAREDQRVIEEAAEAKRALQARIGNSGIPPRFRDRSFETFQVESAAQHRALNFARAFAEDFASLRCSGRSAVFCGRPGTGKTHLASAIGLRVLTDHNRACVRFATALDAIRSVKDTWRRSASVTEREALAALISPDLLILDEVGVQYGSETEKVILFDVINGRYEDRRPTLLVSNLTAQEIPGVIGERAFDRLREDGGEAVVFDWESRRGRV
jgi:DNA replication protein DnaC